MPFLLPLLAITTIGPLPDLPLVDQLDDCVQTRFFEPLPDALGMSRIIRPSSFGRHFVPNMTTERDFHPENPRERKALDALEERHIEMGLYLFGIAITRDDAETLNYRALKGPGIVTRGTPRPAWYPSWYPPLTAATVSPDGALPDWKTIYPIARRAMKSFQDGGSGFETTLDSWTIAARPVVATKQTCVACHNYSVELNHPVGGLIYAFRRVKVSTAPE